jgi:oxidase EvaA
MMYKNEYEEFLNIYQDTLASFEPDFKEMAFERLYSGYSLHSNQDVLSWYEKEVASCAMDYSLIPLAECEGWYLDDQTGSIKHKSGEFFVVNGIRVTNSYGREVVGGWDQPILTQVGYDGGILGLIRKRINDVPHYLVEAKSEPGNPNIIQISTSIQATYSNIKQAHKGSKTPFSELFLQPELNDARVIFERWMSEDGGRLLNKRNKSMIIECQNLDDSTLASRYMWLTMNQLVHFVREHDAIIAPHVRGILSAV